MRREKFRVLQNNSLFIPKKHECREAAIPECMEREPSLTSVKFSNSETYLKWGIEKRGTKKSLRILVCSPVYNKT